MREKRAKEGRRRRSKSADRRSFLVSLFVLGKRAIPIVPSLSLFLSPDSPALAAAATGSVVVTDARVASAALLLLRGAGSGDDATATDERSAAAARRAEGVNRFVEKVFFAR